jgi:low temperature requirement protein LtrA
MLYGLYYAVFVEHQTLDRMGGSLAGAFANAAERRGDDSQLALTAYRETKYDYVRQVDLHSHWIGLAMLLIVLGVVFDEVAFAERARFAIALAMLAGSIVFPLGVILQTVHMAPLGSVLAIAGSALVIAALGATAVGFMREGAT